VTPVETGYEAKFDFPHRSEPPARPYLLASVPRSGSTYLSHVLWRTGCLGAPLEYLNFEPAGPYGFANESPGDQARLWQAALRGRTSPNGVFGLKGFPMQLEALQAGNPALLREVMRTVIPSRAESRIVMLRRRDKTAHTISYARALLSGIWRKEQEASGRAEPEYSRIAFERAGRMIDSQEAAWAAMFADLGIAPLELWYEDVVADPDGAAATVAAHLGLALDPDAMVKIPEIERQSQEGARAWAKRHATSKDVTPPSV
jgi:LPS sulfotransferase NodH